MAAPRLRTYATFSSGILLILLSPCVAKPLLAQSIFPLRPEDPHAVYLAPGSQGVKADGIADDTAAIQQAIDHVQETTGEGIVFIAEGRYRLTSTINLWSGIRLIGYGAHRPVFLLRANTPGFQQGHEFLGTGRYMLRFASRRPAPGAAVVDANEFTFYSGIRNLDFEIDPGNPAAIAIRFHVAQHSFLEDMNFHVGQGRAALEDVGNQASNLHIEGGDYGILSVRTSPAWQFLLLDSTLTGQRRAAIHTQEVGLTLVRDRIAHTPVAVEVTPGMTEQLYARDLSLEDIRQSALLLGDIRKAHHEVTLDHILCTHVKQLIQGDAPPGISGWEPVVAPADRFIEQHLSLGLAIQPDGRERGFLMQHKENVSSSTLPVPSDIPALPPMQEWTNARNEGAKGDGGADDTAALQSAIDRHRVVYLPSGAYRLTHTLHLRPDSVLIGFSPVTTILTAWDKSPAFSGTGPAAPLLQSAHGGSAIVSGIGIAPGDDNPRAAGLLWQAGSTSLVDDVNFMRGHGRLSPLLSPGLPRPTTPPARADAFVDTQYPSLWVNEQGGGRFRDIWTADTIARAGLLVENTSSPSFVYQMSCEHHMHHETQFHHASHWTVYALQTEEENPAGADAFSVELEDAHQITFANLFMYRVSRNVLPKLAAVESEHSSAIHFENVHNFSQTRLAFDNTLYDRTTHLELRSHDFTAFSLEASSKPGPPLPLPAGIFAANATPQQLAHGFSNASGLAADTHGNLSFTDASLHTIYRWNDATKQAERVTDQVPTPMAVAFAGDNTLLAIDYSKTVYAVDPNTGATTRLDSTRTAQKETSLLLPVGFHNSMSTLVRQMEHRGVVYAPRSNMAIVAEVADERRDLFYAPGTTTAILAGGTWQPMLQASQWLYFAIGEEHLATSEEDDSIYHLRLDSLGAITTTGFTPRGGSSVVTDTAGNLYLAAGQLYLYNAAGQQIGLVELPERPSSLAFGGPDHRTLFIGARSSLYSIRTAAAGTP